MSVVQIKPIKPIKPIKAIKANKSIYKIKSYLSSLIINEYNIYYIKNDNPMPLTSIPEIKNWGTVNKLFFEMNGAIILNKKKLHVLQKENNNIRIKIYKTGNTTYVSPVDAILGEQNSFEYKMDILVDGKIVYSMQINSCNYPTDDLKEIKSDMFKLFNNISDKCTFVILYLLSL